MTGSARRAPAGRRSNPAPDESICARLYYHGTPRQDLAERILEEGIKARDATLVHPANARAKMAPIPGKVYLAQSVAYAQIYALGGYMAGHRFDEQHWRGRGRWGYLFVIEGRDLCDVEPDEDAVGHAVERALSGERGVNEYDTWPELSAALDATPARLAQVGAIADIVMTDRQRRRVLEGIPADVTAVGKKVLKRSPADLRLWLVSHGASVAHGGSLMPVEAWRIDKSRAPELNRDGANFFDVAERVGRGRP